MEYIYNPIHNKRPQGAHKIGTEITYTLKISRVHDFTDIYFCSRPDGANQQTIETKMPILSSDGDYNTYECTIKFPTPALYFYYFKLRGNEQTIYLNKSQLFDVEASHEPTTPYVQLIYSRETVVAPEYREGIIYHIFVDRFKKSGFTPKPPKGTTLRRDWGGELTKNTEKFPDLNYECFGGNLLGIVHKLPYIKSLGANTIYLSPIFKSSSYHKYDTQDLSTVDPMFGGDDALHHLIKSAKKHDIEIVLDGVFNHVGSDSIYFRDAIANPNSPYRDWFTFDQFPAKYRCWWGINTLPQLNANNLALQKYIALIVEKYMKMGILGFRLDVVDELCDPYLDTICQKIKKTRHDALVLGEVWEDASTKIAYDKRRHYFDGTQLNAVMNYPLRDAILDFVQNANAENLVKTFYMLIDHYPEHVRNNLMNFLGTHDTVRTYTILANSALTDKPTEIMRLLKIASAIQYLSFGIPSVFYGDEVGVNGGDAPFCRVCFPWGRENREILAWYKKLGQLRARPLFSRGKFNIIYFGHGVIVFERTDKRDRAVIAVNCGNEPFMVNLKNPMMNFETNKITRDPILLEKNNFVILTETVHTANHKTPKKPSRKFQK